MYIAGERLPLSALSIIDGGEWSWTEAPAAVREALAASANALIEVAVEGSAAAAGISFCDFKDFLVPVQPSLGPRSRKYAIRL